MVSEKISLFFFQKLIQSRKQSKLFQKKNITQSKEDILRASYEKNKIRETPKSKGRVWHL